MEAIDVRLFEYVPDANAFIHLSKSVDVKVGTPEHIDVAKRGRIAAITNGNAIGKTRIYGDLTLFEYEKIVLEIRENIGSENAPKYDQTFAWLNREFPSHTSSHIDKVIKDFEGGAYTKRTHTIILTEVDAMKFRLMFPCSSA